MSEVSEGSPEEGAAGRDDGLPPPTTSQTATPTFDTSDLTLPTEVTTEPGATVPEVSMQEECESDVSTATLPVPTKRAVTPPTPEMNRNKRRGGYVEVVRSVVRKVICKICMTPVPSFPKLIVHLDRQHNIHVRGPPRLVTPEERDEKKDGEAMSHLLKSIENQPRLTEPLSDSSEDSDDSDTSDTFSDENVGERERKLKSKALERVTPSDLKKLDLRCHLCYSDFPRHYMLTEHLRLHAEGLLHMCPHCALPFLYHRQLALHLSSLAVSTGPQGQAQVHLCPECPSTFANRACLLFHRTTHDGLHRCPQAQCEKPFLHHSVLRRHIHSTHNKEQRRLPCLLEGCGRSFDTRRGLMTHNINFHSAQKAMSCQTATKIKRRKPAFSLWSSRHKTKNRAVQLPSNSNSKRPGRPKGAKTKVIKVKGPYMRLKCSYCPSRFKGPDAQSTHLASVHKINLSSEKPFVCFLCKRGLDQQKVRNLGNFVGFEFDRSGLLTAHVTKYHPTYSPGQMLTFRPEVEEQSGSGQLTEQMARARFPLKCSLCPLRFKKIDEQSAHLLSEHQINLDLNDPFICYLCKSGVDQEKVANVPNFGGFEFPRASVLTAHLTKYHPDYSAAQMLTFREEGTGPELEVHVQLKYKCSYCSLRFKKIDAQRSHLQREHRIDLSLQKPFVCHLCKRGKDQALVKGAPYTNSEFGSTSSLVTHLTKYHPTYSAAQMLTFRPKTTEEVKREVKERKTRGQAHRRLVTSEESTAPTEESSEEELFVAVTPRRLRRGESAPTAPKSLVNSGRKVAGQQKRNPRRNTSMTPNKVPFVCLICHRWLSSQQSLDSHLANFHFPPTTKRKRGAVGAPTPYKVKVKSEGEETVTKGFRNCPVCAQKLEVGRSYNAHVSWHGRRKRVQKNRGRKPALRGLLSEAEETGWEECPPEVKVETDDLDPGSGDVKMEVAEDDQETNSTTDVVSCDLKTDLDPQPEVPEVASFLCAVCGEEFVTKQLQTVHWINRHTSRGRSHHK